MGLCRLCRGFSVKLWGCMSSPREEWTEGREGPRAEPLRSSGEERLSTSD